MLGKLEQQPYKLIPARTIIFISNSPKYGFNEGDGDLMDKLTSQLKLALNVSEEQLLHYSMLCRYALKLDLKGFSENASAIISAMIGLCLPVIAQPGLVTPAFSKQFAPALHLLDSKLALCGSEVMPASIDISALSSVIGESEENYRQRLKAILDLRASKQFDIQTTTRTLFLQAFLPLCKLLKVYTPSFTYKEGTPATVFFAPAKRLTANMPTEHTLPKAPSFIRSKL